MKKLMTALGLLAFLAIPAQSAFAWEYDGLGSLNPFTNFGRGFGGGYSNCGCQKVERPRLTKCEKLHGYKIERINEPTGCAAPVIIEPMEYCDHCTKAF